MQAGKQAQSVNGAEYKSPNGVVLLIGPSFRYAKSLTRAIEGELEDVAVQHAESIAGVIKAGPEAHSAVQLAIVDHALLEDFVRERDALLAVLPRVISAVSYDETAFCAAIIVEHLRNHRISSAVPMNLQIDKWLSAIRLMMAGEDYVPVNLIKMMGEASAVERLQSAIQLPHGNGHDRPLPARADEITRREEDVLRLVAEGHQNKEIAARLKLSEHTVKLHIHHIFAKLGAHNRTQAVRIFYG
jgi:DNA-binding NarL/FixJ family response regulator